jgi:hypothetical protein
VGREERNGEERKERKNDEFDCGFLILRQGERDGDRLLRWGFDGSLFGGGGKERKGKDEKGFSSDLRKTGESGFEAVEESLDRETFFLCSIPHYVSREGELSVKARRERERTLFFLRPCDPVSSFVQFRRAGFDGAVVRAKQGKREDL